MEQQTKPKPGAPDPAPESKPAAAAKPTVEAKRKCAAAAAQSKRKPVAKPKSTAKSSHARDGERTPDRARQWAHVLGAQDEVAQALARYHRRAAASPGMPPLLSTLMKSQAELVRSASDAYVSTARRFLDGTAPAEQPRR
jgi:hypothetical protein